MRQIVKGRAKGPCKSIYCRVLSPDTKGEAQSFTSVLKFFFPQVSAIYWRQPRKPCFFNPQNHPCFQTCNLAFVSAWPVIRRFAEARIQGSAHFLRHRGYPAFSSNCVSAHPCLIQRVLFRNFFLSSSPRISQVSFFLFLFLFDRVCCKSPIDVAFLSLVLCIFSGIMKSSWHVAALVKCF